MEYNKLVAVSGLPGLYELVSSKKDGAIVRSLEDKTTKFAATRIHQFSHLESIEIYTVGNNVNLADVFQAMEKNSETLPDVKDDKAIKSYFQKVYPDMDFDRVYNSDMKKMVKWFDILKKNNIEIKLSELPEEEEDATATEATETPAKEEEHIAPQEKETATKKKGKEPETLKGETEKHAPEKEAKAPAKKAAAKKKPAAKKKAD